MAETSRFWLAALVFLAACAAPEPAVVEQTTPQPVVTAPPEPPAQPAPDPRVAEAKAAEEARALLAQAETDIQRARAKRALWLPAWENLLGARESLAARNYAPAIRRAQRASDFARLGLEQLAYPAVASRRPDEPK
jgi:hypothetical protein